MTLWRTTSVCARRGQVSSDRRKGFKIDIDKTFFPLVLLVYSHDADSQVAAQEYPAETK